MTATAPGPGASESAPQDVSEIETEIEATRAEIDRTLSALGARLSPRRRLRAALDTIRERGAGLAERGGQLARGAAGLAKRQSAPLTAVGMAGLAVFLAFRARRR